MLDHYLKEYFKKLAQDECTISTGSLFCTVTSWTGKACIHTGVQTKIWQH